MRIDARYDVVVAGGGLAGLCLAIQLKRVAPQAHVLVAEKDDHPLPEAAHKVGESSVEVASHYFREVLGLSGLLEHQLPKFGLRFFLSQGTNHDIAARLECGASHFLSVPSFQIDRGLFENELARQAEVLGVHFVDECEVTSISLGRAQQDHTVGLACPSERVDVQCRWLVDASGRAGLLKKRLDLSRPNRHDVNAAWFRIDDPIDLDDWSDDPRWRSRLKHSRRLSTNHLMGAGYWVWLIPLANDRTSVGIVADEHLHPFSEINTFEKALAWLEHHEPQCAAVVAARSDRRMDFRALRNYSHDVKQVFSADRWCLTGDAGMFLDPFYSPGGDFIGLANGFVSDLVSRDLRSEAIAEAVESYDQAYRSLARTYMATYHRQYPLMGNARVMTTKIVWDFAMYWGSVALLSFADRWCDPAFMDRVRPNLHTFAYTNIGMQAFFRDWAQATPDDKVPEGSFVDYAELHFLAELNRDLQRKYDDEALLERMLVNLELVKDLKQEILAEATRVAPGVTRREASPTTEHLGPMFAALRRA